MKLLDAVKRWEVCHNQPTRIYGCLLEDCPLHEDITIRTGDSVSGEATLKIQGCMLIGALEAFLRNKKPGSPIDVNKRKGMTIQELMRLTR